MLEELVVQAQSLLIPEGVAFLERSRFCWRGRVQLLPPTRIPSLGALDSPGTLWGERTMPECYIARESGEGQGSVLMCVGGHSVLTGLEEHIQFQDALGG